jgi:hypothetical protein
VVTYRTTGDATTDAVHFVRTANSAPLLAAAFQVDGQVAADDQRRTFPVAGWQTAPDPFADGVPMDAKEPNDLMNAVRAVDFDEPRVGMWHGGDALKPDVTALCGGQPPG